MTARRRKWILAVTLLGLVAMVWCFGRGGGRMEVKLVFLGYTNYDGDMPDLSGLSPGEVFVFARRTPDFQAICSRDK